MTWIVESPWPAITAGVLLEVALAIALLRSGRGVFLFAMGFVLLATAGMLVLERVVVTETEEVEDALAGVESALEANDATRVLAHFATSSPRRSDVESALGRFRISEARIGRDLELTVNHLTSPPSANAYFTGRVEAHDTRSEIPYDNMIGKFHVTLHREDGQWRIYDYAVQEQYAEQWAKQAVRGR